MLIDPASLFYFDIKRKFYCIYLSRKYVAVFFFVILNLQINKKKNDCCEQQMAKINA